MPTTFKTALFFLVAALFILGPVHANSEPLANWLRDLSMRKAFHPPRISPPPASTISLPHQELVNERPELSDWLKKKKLNSPSTWQMIPIAPHLIPPKGRPTVSWMNRFYFSAKTEDKEIIFFPVDTKSSCDTGCAPIVFSLVYLPAENRFFLLNSAANPLQGYGHEVLGKESIQLLEKNLQDLSWFNLTHPRGSTDLNHQTWSFYNTSLAKGAAYSSYRVYEAGLLIQEMLQTKKQSTQWTLLQNSIGQLYRVQNKNESDLEFKKITAKLKEKNLLLPSVRTQLQRHANILSLYPFWTAEESSVKKFQAAVNSRKLQEDDPFFLCQATLSFLGQERSQKLIRQAFSNPSFQPCHKDDRPWLKFLAQEKTNSNASELESKKIPSFIREDENLLLRMTQVIQSAKSPLKSSALAWQKLLYPETLQSSDLKNFKLNAKETTELLKTLEQEYNQSLSPKRSGAPKSELLTLEGKSAFPSKGKRVYIFFQGWCSHCQKLLASLGRAFPKKNDWKNIQLIEVKAQNDDLIQSLGTCVEKGVSEEACGDMALIAANNMKLRQDLNLTAVPRIITINSKDEIVDFDLKLNLESEELLKAQVKWAVEAAK